MNYMKTLYHKYKDVVPYAVFGVLTTLVNIAVYWLLVHPLNLEVMAGTITAWITAVLFAYVTNRRWVFHSEARNWGEILKELSSFFACRLITGVIDWTCMLVFVDILQFNDVVIKAGANVIVIILNYIASKQIIFKR